MGELVSPRQSDFTEACPLIRVCTRDWPPGELFIVNRSITDEFDIDPEKKWQGYDQWKNEHVIMLEYRVKVNSGIHPPAKPPQNLRDLHAKPPVKPIRQAAPMATIRELMDVKFVNTVDSSPSPPSPKNSKSTTGKSALRPKKFGRTLQHPWPALLKR